MPLHPGARGLLDDAAVLELGSETLVITHDIVAEGTHVLAGQDPADIAWRLVAANLSDLAGKGAEPLGVILGHMLGEGDERFLEGLHAALGAFGTPLLGGDTVRGKGPRSWGMTAIGRATHVPVPSRAGSRPGDCLYVSGELGRAKAAFEAIAAVNGESEAAYRRPMPMLDEGRALAPHVTAMMDCSDGLCLDARRMAEASSVTIALDSARIPVSQELIAGWRKKIPDLRLSQERALALSHANWGEDYVLLFTARPDAALPVAASEVGRVIAQGEHALLIDGAPPPAALKLGYTHG